MIDNPAASPASQTGVLAEVHRSISPVHKSASKVLFRGSQGRARNNDEGLESLGDRLLRSFFAQDVNLATIGNLQGQVIFF